MKYDKMAKPAFFMLSFMCLWNLDMPRCDKDTDLEPYLFKIVRDNA